MQINNDLKISWLRDDNEFLNKSLISDEAFFYLSAASVAHTQI